MYRNFKSREILIGKLTLGGNNPVRLQSMTSVNTMDTDAIIAQSIRMIEAGSELVRITAPGIREAEQLALIKQKLQEKNYGIPIIADIHYSPKAAETAARIVEKVRINPGNYTDKKRGKTHWSEKEYNDDIARIEERLFPLIEICKSHNTAMRIGSNQGSLSERIMARYGDTAEGMVASALEFVRICRRHDYHRIVLSMKSSNTQTMLAATRLLVQQMMDEGMDYPLHLGVTEAGEGQDGRIKSALGIGSLLNEGIGDTIRVSLTEDPEFELPVARKIVALNPPQTLDDPEKCSPVFYFERRKSEEYGNLGGQKLPQVISRTSQSKTKADYIILEDAQKHVQLQNQHNQHEILPAVLIDGINAGEIIPEHDVIIACLKDLKEFERLFATLKASASENPVILAPDFDCEDKESYQLKMSSLAGNLLSRGLGDGIFLQSRYHDEAFCTETAFAILQAARRRFSKTEYISCPSCGRTQFNIQKAVQKVREATEHLSGITIGVMGCIVNGPGEMAGADYGYIGAGGGKVVLFKGDQAVSEKIEEDKAIDELVQLIKKYGDWIDPD